MTRLLGPDPVRLRVRLFGAEIVAAVGMIASLYLAGKITEKG